MDEELSISNIDEAMRQIEEMYPPLDVLLLPEFPGIDWDWVITYLMLYHGINWSQIRVTKWMSG